MARPKTATKLHIMRGSFKNHPERKPANEPEGVGAFPKRPPSRLSAAERSAWRAIVKQVPQGVLTGSDQIAVEIAACLLAEYREDPRGMATARIGRLVTELNRLGCTPSGRASLQVLLPQKNEFDDLDV